MQQQQRKTEIFHDNYSEYNKQIEGKRNRLYVDFRIAYMISHTDLKYLNDWMERCE